MQTTSPDGYIQTSSGLKYKITKAVYSGNTVKDGETHLYHYSCKLSDGTIIDNSYGSGPPYRSIIEKGRFLPGFYEALKLLKPGEKGSFILPPNLAYGSAGRGKIPPKATLLYEIEVLNNRKQ